MLGYMLTLQGNSHIHKDTDLDDPRMEIRALQVA
jgi:hypothetical protein